MIILDILFGIYFLWAGIINFELMCSFGFGVWQSSSYFAKSLCTLCFLVTMVELVFIQCLNHALCLSLFSCCYFHIFAPSMHSAFHCFHVVTFIYFLYPFNFYVDNLYHCHHYLCMKRCKILGISGKWVLNWLLHEWMNIGGKNQFWCSFKWHSQSVTYVTLVYNLCDLSHIASVT